MMNRRKYDMTNSLYCITHKCCLLLILGLLISGLVISQQTPVFNKMVDFLPPAPNATAMIQYGNASLNKNTGAPNVNIPLYTLKGKKLSTSISIGYSTSGLKVDEIASRVGMGWSLNAGGVVTRVVRGIQDEHNIRSSPWAPIDYNWSTLNFCMTIEQDLLSNPNTTGHRDSEPDLFNFSFDGYSGSFILDHNMKPVLINKNGLKIEADFDSDIWNFRITTTEGIQYLFGGTGAIEKTKRLTTCGRTYTTAIPTSWYLKKIIHPNQEIIEFNYTPITYTYDNSVSQTMYARTASTFLDCTDMMGTYPVTCNEIPTLICTNITQTEGVLLHSIESNGNFLVLFTYTDRQDNNDKLLSRITYGVSPYERRSYFEFSYLHEISDTSFTNETYYGNNKTPYLVDLFERSADGQDAKRHQFSYIDPTGRAPRLSFAQDHWGYFNGKHNSSFVPPSSIILYGQYDAFPYATANKESDGFFAQKGMLKKIIYPTGGYNVFFYEPNKFENGLNSYYTSHELTCNVTGTGLETEKLKYNLFRLNNAQYVTLHIKTVDNGGYPVNGPHPPICNVDIEKIGTIPYVFHYDALHGTPDSLIRIHLDSGNYKIKLTAQGISTTTEVILNYYPTLNQGADSKKIVGGVRVEKIITGNSNDSPQVKKYYYGSIEDINTPTLLPFINPFYTGMFYKMVCLYTAPHFMYQLPPISPGGCKYFSNSSSSISNINFYNNQAVSYGSVIESNGENFEGGGIESKFLVAYDVPAQTVLNQTVLNAPLSNFGGLFNGKLYEESLLKKMSDGSLKPIKKTEYLYYNDPAHDTTLYGFTVSSSMTGFTPSQYANGFDTTCQITNPSCVNQFTYMLDDYNIMKYYIRSTFVYPEQEIQTIYDEKGENPVVTTKNYYYGNTQNFQVTSTESENSSHQLIKNNFTYPHDYPGNNVYDSMVQKNMISQLVTSQLIVNNVKQSMDFVNYGDMGNNNYLPVSIQKAIKEVREPSTEGTFDLYDSLGNILQFTGKNGIIKSIIWGYSYQYPIAEITGESYNHALAALGNTTVEQLQSLDSSELMVKLNLLRTGLPEAQVTTYTYKKLVGVKTITDLNGKTNSYEYDSFGRLALIRDQDNNIVKKIEYAIPGLYSVPVIFYNALRVQNIQCNTCQNGYSGSSVEYTVPAGKYYSLVSQTDADDQALLEITTKGQEYANMNGTCSNTALCTGEGYKFTNCACEFGEKIIDSCSQPNSDGSWSQYYHYEWSDGSTSQPYNITIPACTGVDKKKIGCECETGTKVCDGTPVLNQDGTYTVNYHYTWSDNSTSSQIVETFTCSGQNKKMIGCNCETGSKFYVGSETGSIDCPGMTKCSFKYHWSDNTYSDIFYECKTGTDPCPTN